MRGLPVLVVVEHVPSASPPLALQAGDGVMAGRSEPSRWPAFRSCATTDGRTGWVVDRVLDLASPRSGTEADEPATLLADYDTTELAARPGDVGQALWEDGLWLWCEAPDGRAGWLPLAAVTLDPAHPVPAVPTGRLGPDDVPAEVFAFEWSGGAPRNGLPEPDGTGAHGYPLRGTTGLTVADYRRMPTATRRHELHRGRFGFPDREPMRLALLRSQLSSLLFDWSQEHGGRSVGSGPSCVLSHKDVVWPWLGVLGRGSRQRWVDREVDGPPDLAVEVIGDHDPHLEDRLALLGTAGTPEIWVIEPNSGAVEVRTPGGLHQVGADDPLSSTALPGLRLDPAHRTVQGS